MNEKIKIKLNDESVFSIESNDQISALRMKLDVDDLTIDEFTPFFTKEVEKHWNDRTVLTKFPWDRKKVKLVPLEKM